jgi:hypothetical protein
MATAMLADFATRLGCGLAVMLLATPWRSVPPPFFRTQCQVILALLVLAALDLGRAGGSPTETAIVVASAVLAYFGSVAWGLGLPRVGLPIALAIALLAGGGLVWGAEGSTWEIQALNASGRLASAVVIGSTLTAMLLGHYYLTAPSMSITPLRGLVRWMSWTLMVRALLAGLGVWLLYRGAGESSLPSSVSPFFLAVRWGMGFGGTSLATYLTWKTVEIRSTQSATGILYIALALVLFGELAAMTMSRSVGVLL